MALRDELIKIFVDKLLLGTLVAVFGFYLSALLERFRSRQSFSNELNKIRVQKIAEVWEKLYEFEQSGDILHEPGDELELELKKSTRYVTLFLELQMTLLQNKFWIEDAGYKEITTYIDLLHRLTRARKEGDEKVIHTLSQERTTLKRTIVQVRDRLMNGG